MAQIIWFLPKKRRKIKRKKKETKRKKEKENKKIRKLKLIPTKSICIGC